MLAWRMEAGGSWLEADGAACACLAINQQGQRQQARSDVLCTHRARLRVRLVPAIVPALCLLPTSAMSQNLQTGSVGLSYRGRT
jgi:hypothetical protein